MLPAGQSAITGYAKFWGEGSNEYNLYINRPSIRTGIARVLRRPSYREITEALFTILGTAVGQTALSTFSQVSAPDGLTQSELLGGSRTINAVTAISRVTVASDLTYMQDEMTNRRFGQAIASYPTDASGNGGGGKAGTH